MFLCVTALLLQGFLITLAAERLILILFSQEHPLVVVDQSVADISQCTALDADGMHLGHFIGDGAQGWHWSEGQAFEVHIKSCHDDSYAPIGKLVAYISKSVVQKLSLVDTHHVNVCGKQQE